jgi:hypothetical protein
LAQFRLDKPDGLGIYSEFFKNAVYFQFQLEKVKHSKEIPFCALDFNLLLQFNFVCFIFSGEADGRRILQEFRSQKDVCK